MAERTINVLHFSSRYEECGVAKYLAHHINGMADAPGIHNEYFEVSPYETYNMKPSDLDNMVHTLEAKLKDYDILHVQHEFALYAHDSFRRIVEAGKRSGKKVVITVHISPAQHGDSKPVRLHGLGPRSWMLFLKETRRHRHFVRTHLAPFLMADRVLAHNELTISDLQSLGVRPDRIKKLPHPVQFVDKPRPTNDIAKHLNKRPGDVIYCTIGFLHRYKGITEAIKALKYLPSNYKLAILGGMKADSDDIAFYDKICDLIDSLGLEERVYIAGYIKDDEILNANIRECDVCVFAYDKVYYAAVSSGSLNLAFANGMPTIAFPTTTIKELAAEGGGAVVLCDSFAYYELARELQRIDLKKQARLSTAYAEKMAWPNVSKKLVKIYQDLV
jgi:glycosyltransferase involved in cell wall biosynthesis